MRIYRYVFLCKVGYRNSSMWSYERFTSQKNDIEGAIRDIKERHPKATKLDFIKILTQD